MIVFATGMAAPTLATEQTLTQPVEFDVPSPTQSHADTSDDLRRAYDTLQAKYAELYSAVSESGPGVFENVYRGASGDTFFLGYLRDGVISTPLHVGKRFKTNTGVVCTEVSARVYNHEAQAMQWEPRGYLIGDDGLVVLNASSADPEPVLTVRESILSAIEADQHTAAEIIAFVKAQTNTLDSSIRTMLCTLANRKLIERVGTPGEYTYWLLV